MGALTNIQVHSANFHSESSECVADILNSNPQRSAHPIQGAAFLSYFVDESIPWAHLDIAGVASVESDPVTGAGSTGWGVRLLHTLVRGMAT